MMHYDANKKSVGVAYLLWFFLGGLGAHRFYLGETTTGVAILLITVISLVLMILLIGLFTIWIAVAWVIVDAFLIPNMVRKYNDALATKLELATTATVAATT
jgi:TM2 domain-containing membrane protein YozV